MHLLLLATAVMRLCGPNKIGNLPAYALPARRTISNRTANVPQLPVLRSGRAARAPPARRQLPAAARLLQAIQAKYEGKYRQIQANMNCHISSYMHVSFSAIQAYTGKYELLY
jgi:hypothetical protein